MRITELTEKGALARWLAQAAPVIGLDLEWRVAGDSDRNNVIYSGAVTGPTRHDIALFDANLLPELLTAKEGTEFIAHYAASDLKHLAWAGVRLHDKYKVHDTLIYAHLLDENSDHDLGTMVLTRYGDNYKAEFKAKYRLPEDAPPAENADYNARDVLYLPCLLGDLRRELAEDGVPNSLIEHVHRLQLSLLETQIDGVAVDLDYLMAKGVELKSRLTEIVPKMRELVASEIDLIECDEWIKQIEKVKKPETKARVKRPEFNWNSNPQLLRLFYDELKLPVQMGEPKKDKKTGRYSPPKPTVDTKALHVLKDIHPIADQMRYYRAFEKAYGTYVEGILAKMVNGRIYPSFGVTGTTTGRISHSDPNLGNLPSAKRAKELDEPFLAGIRGMFVPDPGYVLISADFSQLEVCLSAHFTRDTQLLRIVNEGVSQHDITAEGLGIPRSLAKTVNFGMQYGCSHKKVAKVLKVSEEEGKKAYDKYWETYSGQKRVMDECAAKVDRGEPIISPFGRRRRFEVRKRQSWDSAYRQSWNALVQGTGSDCTSRAFYQSDSRLRERGIGRALFTVHDEIVITAKEEHAEEAQKILLETMTAVGREIGLTVELKAEGSGSMPRWLD